MDRPSPFKVTLYSIRMIFDVNVINGTPTEISLSNLGSMCAVGCSLSHVARPIYVNFSSYGGKFGQNSKCHNCCNFILELWQCRKQIHPC
jgi:hypothetical protein